MVMPMSDRLGTGARLRRLIEETADGALTPHDHTGVVDEREERDALSWLAAEYDHAEFDEDMPLDFFDTATGAQLLAHYRTDRATRDLDTGNSSALGFHVGERSGSSSFSTSKQLLKVLQRLRVQGYLGLFCGSTDGGKTNTALLMAELAMRDDPDLHLATNIDPLEWSDADLDDRTHFVDSTSSLVSVCEDHEDVVAVLDELSTEMNATTQNYDVVDGFYSVVTWKSKYGLRIIGIAHRVDGYDMHPALREHADDFIKQQRDRRHGEPDEYAAEFFDRRLDDGDLAELKMKLSDIPETSARYDPDATATFDVSE